MRLLTSGGEYKGLSLRAVHVVADHDDTQLNIIHRSSNQPLCSTLSATRGRKGRCKRKDGRDKLVIKKDMKKLPFGKSILGYHVACAKMRIITLLYLLPNDLVIQCSGALSSTSVRLVNG